MVSLRRLVPGAGRYRSSPLNCGRKLARPVFASNRGRSSWNFRRPVGTTSHCSSSSDIVGRRTSSRVLSPRTRRRCSGSSGKLLFWHWRSAHLFMARKSWASDTDIMSKLRIFLTVEMSCSNQSSLSSTICVPSQITRQHFSKSSSVICMSCEYKPRSACWNFAPIESAASFIKSLVRSPVGSLGALEAAPALRKDCPPRLWYERQDAASSKSKRLSFEPLRLAARLPPAMLLAASEAPPRTLINRLWRSARLSSLKARRALAFSRTSRQRAKTAFANSTFRMERTLSADSALTSILRKLRQRSDKLGILKVSAMKSSGETLLVFSTSSSVYRKRMNSKRSSYFSSTSM
mmetsp:Transcript_14977/g.42580  ORF Transcript_14977/g.42580 Transcript_14977/m.42580 type:complete len:349 (-) Transcript_14977:614-1660(-)